MPNVPLEQPLPYAAPGVRTAPRRTLPRVLARSLWNLVRGITGLIQAVLLVLGYAVVVVAFVVGAVLVAAAALLLYAGRLRWDGRAVRVWAARTFNRTWMAATRRLRRRGAVPLAMPLRVDNR